MFLLSGQKGEGCLACDTEGLQGPPGPQGPPGEIGKWKKHVRDGLGVRCQFPQMLQRESEDESLVPERVHRDSHGQAHLTQWHHVRL